MGASAAEEQPPEPSPHDPIIEDTDKDMDTLPDGNDMCAAAGIDLNIAGDDVRSV